MTTRAIEDCIQPIARTVTRKIEIHASARPDEQTIRLHERTDCADPLPRAELIRLMTQNYEHREIETRS